MIDGQLFKFCSRYLFEEYRDIFSYDRTRFLDAAFENGKRFNLKNKFTLENFCVTSQFMTRLDVSVCLIKNIILLVYKIFEFFFKKKNVLTMHSFLSWHKKN